MTMNTNTTNFGSVLRSEDSISSNTSSSSEITFTKSSSSPISAIRRLYRKLSSRKQQQSPTDVIHRVFAYFDEDGDGKISAAELQSCVKAVGGEMTPEEAELAVRSSDSDGDGEFGIEDFSNLMKREEDVERDGELRGAFRMYVMEGGDCITPTSLNRMLSRLGESASTSNCKDMIRKFDANGDGVLNFEEFRVMMA